MNAATMGDDIFVRVEQGDALLTAADALAIQYPQRLYGLVERVVKICAAEEHAVLLPQKDGMRLLEGVSGVAARRILLVGVTRLQEYDYRDLQSFARLAIARLAAIPNVRQVALPAYGPPGIGWTT